MDERTHTDLQSALIALVERGQTDEEAYRASLSAEERTRVGVADAWAPKEVIAHLGYWKRKQAERLEAVARGETPPDEEDFEQLNAESWPEHARLTWEESVARSDQATRDLIAALAATPSEILAGQSGSPEGQLISLTLGDSYGHINTHISDHYLALGDRERALRIQRDMLDAIVAAGLEGGAEGGAHYNLACFYALHEEPAEAIVELRHALWQRPDLIAWARKDPDLDSLRADPDYQTLVPPMPAEDA